MHIEKSLAVSLMTARGPGVQTCQDSDDTKGKVEPDPGFSASNSGVFEVSMETDAGLTKNMVH